MRSQALSHRFRPLRAILAVALLTAAGACSPAAEAPVDEASAIQRYEGRGVVGRLPSDSTPALTIRHEPIPEFVDFEGKVVGMDSMSMPFPLAGEIDLAGIEPGDKVSFTLEVEWDGDVPYRISRIEELPPDTPLDLGG